MKRIIAIFLIVMSVLILASCGGNASSDESSNATDITTDAPAKDILFTGGEHTYTITRPDPTSDAVKDSAIMLYGALKNLDKNITITTDWVRPGESAPEYEIVVGNADREEVRALLPQLPYCGFIVKVVGEKLIVLAIDEDSLDDAVEYVIDLIESPKLTLKSDFLHIEDAKEGNYPLADAYLGEHKLTDYSISGKKAALNQTLQHILGEATGKFIPIVSDDAEGPLLVVGASALTQPTPTEYYEYRIESKDEDVYFYAYGEHEYGHSFKAFAELIENADNKKIILTETIDSYKLPSREDYINDPSKLYMLWDYLWEAPEWMLDFDDKRESLFGGKGSDKLYASAHRAELKFYPENSIEAVISTYYMGAAIAELDFGATKDGVLVLLHDDTLDRTTNVAQFVSTPGFPDTTYVSDWTYSQLLALNLKEGGGGSGAKITPFKIATLEEALNVCKDRLFIVPDKYYNWQYVRSTDIMQGSKQNYLSDLMKKTGNLDSILISYGNSGSSNYLNATDAVKLQTLLKTETGVAPYILLRCTPDKVASNYDYFIKKAAPQSFALQLNGDYRGSTNYSSAYATHGDKVTFLAWTIGTGTGWNDYLSNWQAMYKKGLRVIMTNDLFNLVQYCEKVGARVNSK